MMTEDARLPFPGLRAFNRDESDLFFGRDEAVNDMVDKLAETRFLAVIGASGTGKSSLVRTGLLDGLELGLHPAGSDWVFAIMTPGGQPLANLACALCQVSDPDGGHVDHHDDPFGPAALLEGRLRRGPQGVVDWRREAEVDTGTHVLVLVDQFEELFRFASYADREDAEAFVNLLMAAVEDASSRVHVVITMRSEFLGACALIPGLAERLNDGAYLTPRMTREECRKAIIGPARLVGAEIESSLVTRLLNDIASFAPWEGGDGDHLRTLARRADQLPVMQHLLNRLWSHASAGGEGRLTVRLGDYETLGGLGGALDAHGAEVLDRIDRDKHAIVERLFKALVAGTTVADAVRRPLALEDLAGEVGEPLETVAALVDRFRANDCNFLRPSPPLPIHPDTVIDISHESLIRQWTTLANWVMEEARAARYWRRLENAADRYAAGEDELLSGLALQNLLQWRRGAALGPHWARRYAKDYEKTIGYLEESERAEIARQDAQAARARHERRRLQKWLAGISALALVASSSAVWGWIQHEATTEAWRSTSKLMERVGTNVVEQLDGDVQITWRTAHDLIQNMEELMESSVSSGGERGQRTLAEPRALFYLKSTQTLLKRGSLAESYKYAQALNRILEAHKATWVPCDTLANDMDLAIAESARRNARLDEAKAHLDRAAARLAASPQRDTEWYASKAELLSEQVAIHSQEWSVARQVAHYHELVRHADAVLGRLSDPQRVANTEEATNDVIRRVALAAVKGVLKTVPVVFFAALDERGDLRVDQMARYAEKLVNKISVIDGEDGVSFRRIKALLQLRQAWVENTIFGKEQAALNNTDNAVFALEKLVADDPDNLETRVLLAEALVRRAQYAIVLGNTNRAAADIAAARSLLHALRTTVADPTITFWPTSTLFWVETQLYEAQGDDQAYLAAAARFLAWARHYLGTEHAELVKEARGETLSAWIALRGFENDDRDPRELQKIVDFALPDIDHRTLSPDDRYFMTRDRSFIFFRLTALGPERIGRQYWLERMSQGIEEAGYLVEKNGTAKNKMNLVYIMLGFEKSRLNDMEQDFSDDAVHRIVDVLKSTLEQKNFSSSDFRDFLYYIADIVHLLDSHSSLDRHLPILRSIVDMLVPERLTGQWSETENAGNVNHLLRLLEENHEALTASSETDTRPEVMEAVTALETLINHIDSAKEVEDDTTVATPVSTDTAGHEARAAPDGVEETPPRQAGESPVAEDAVKTQDLRQLGVRDAGWTFGPVYRGAWRTLEGSEYEEAKDDLADALSPHDLKEVRSIRQVYLPFYENGRLLDVQVSGVRGEEGKEIPFTGVKSFIVNDGGVFELDGTSPPIHDANAKGPIQLEDAQTVAAYMRFFTTFVNGEDGAFQIIEHTDDMAWTASASPSEVASVAAVLRPLVVWPAEDEAGAWRAMAAVHYASHIFHADFLTKPTGMMEMLTDQPVTGELSTEVVRIRDRAQGRGPRTFGLTVRDGDEDSSGSVIDLAAFDVHPVATFDEEARLALIGSFEMAPEQGAALRDEYLAQLGHAHVIRVMSGEALQAILLTLAEQGLTEPATALVNHAVVALGSDWRETLNLEAGFRNKVGSLLREPDEARDRVRRVIAFLEALAHDELVSADLLNFVAYSLVIKDVAPEAALRLAERAIDGTENGFFLDTYGVALAKMGDATRALEVLERAARLEPNHAEIRLNLARVQIDHGDKDAARITLEDALALEGSAEIMSAVEAELERLSGQ